MTLSPGRSRLRCIGFGLLLAFLLLEVALRLGGYSHDVGRFRSNPLRVSKDPELGYVLAPDTDGWAWLCGVRTNSLGLRGPEPAPAGDGMPRVVVLGDSVAFGVFNPESASIPVRLEAALRESGRPHHVFNAAVPGYDVVQAVAFLERRALPLEPDVVVLLYGLNDAGVAAQDPRFRDLADRLHNSWLASSRAIRMGLHLGEMLHLYRDFRVRNEPERFARDYAGYLSPIGPDEAELRALMRASRNEHEVMGSWYAEEVRVGRVRHSFERLARLAGRKAFRVVVAVYPWLGETEPYPFAGAHRVVEYEARRLGFDWLDLVEPLTRGGARLAERSHFPDDPFHLNAEANEWVARALEAVVAGRHM